MEVLKKDKLEYFDVVNEKDEVIGKIPENEQHNVNPSELRFINILIKDDKNKIIVPKRSSNRKIFPNCYDFSVGGHVNSGETYEQAAYRELEEELGIKSVTLKKIAYFNPYNSKSNTFQTVYTLNYNAKIINYDKNGISKIFYMTVQEIQDLMNKQPQLFKTDYIAIMNSIFDLL